MVRKLPNRVSWKHAALACCLLGICFGQPSRGNAQEPTPTLETITVIGSRVPRTDPQIASITVIDEQAIEARNDSNGRDLLRDVPGVHVSHPGGRGNLGSIFIRASEPNYGAVLVDGIQVNDPTNTRGGSFDFSTHRQASSAVPQKSSRSVRAGRENWLRKILWISGMSASGS